MKVLLVEDDPDLLDLTAYALRRERFTVFEASDGLQALLAVRSVRPDVVVLDIGLPGRDGFQVLTEIRARQKDLPVIMLTGHQAEADVIRCFTLEADDYLKKPFSSRELVMRLRNVLRRAVGEDAPRPQTPLEKDGLRVDPDTHEVGFRGNSIRFTPIEFRILYLLMLNAERITTTSRLLAYVWGHDGGDTNVLRTHITHIRRKLEENGVGGTIENVSGTGYLLSLRPGAVAPRRLTRAATIA